jgi:hypothetical protein
MKNLILNLLIVLTVFSSCQKEDDLLQPLPQDPSITNNTNTNNGDTLNVNNGDTIINNGNNELVAELNHDLIVANGNNNGVTILPPSTTFIGEGKKYNVKRAEFEINCSELTSQHFDTSYSYVSTNFVSPLYHTDYPNGIGNGIIDFPTPTQEGRFWTTVYPVNGNASPTHSWNFNEMTLPLYILDYTYSAGVINLQLEFRPCNPNDPSIVWWVTMNVTEYSDGTVALSIDQGPYNFAGVTWDSHLKVVLEE